MNPENTDRSAEDPPRPAETETETAAAEQKILDHLQEKTPEYPPPDTTDPAVSRAPVESSGNASPEAPAEHHPQSLMHTLEKATHFVDGIALTVGIAGSALPGVQHGLGLDSYAATPQEPNQAIVSPEGKVPSLSEPGTMSLPDGRTAHLTQDTPDNPAQALLPDDMTTVQTQKDKDKDFPPDESPNRDWRRHPDGDTPDNVQRAAGQWWREHGQS